MNQHVIAYYDSLLDTENLVDYTDHSAFAAFGFSYKHTTDSKQASCNLDEKLLAFIPEKSGAILDVACGLGATTEYLLRCCPPTNVMALNISE